MSDDDALFALLPPAAREALALAFAARQRFDAGDDKGGFNEALVQTTKAMYAVGIPEAAPGAVHPVASSYDEVQRAALAWSATHNLAPLRCACPGPSNTRRRWLGIDPQGVLETQMIDIARDGVATTEPLWRALRIAQDAAGQAEILDALPTETVLRALSEMFEVGFGYGLGVPGNLAILERLGDEGRAWAIAQADTFPTEPHYAGSLLKKYIFIALVRAKVPIEPRWEHLYPNVMGASNGLLVECARALPDDRRAAVLAKHFPALQSPIEMIAAFPTTEMVRALLDGAEANSRRWSWFVEQLHELGKTNAVVRDAVLAVVAATPKPMDLYVTSTVKPKSAEELTELAKEQLCIAGKGYDKHDLDASARLAKNGEETSFHGFFELRAVADANGSPLYDVLLYMGDAGSIFTAGTTNEIGALSQGGVVLKEKNDALRLALQVAVSKKPLKMKAKKAPAKKAPAQKAPPKKPARPKK